MTKTLMLLTALATLLSGTPNFRPAVPVAADVVMIGMSPSEQVMARRAVQSFAEAGLRLPPVVFRRHQEKSNCGGFDGLYRTSPTKSVVELCTTDSPDWVQRTLLHELAHAWAFHYLSAERKELFRKLRGWQYWNDYHHARWEDNGSEQAAEIIAWGLNDRAVPVLRIDQNTCADLRAGYEALTGNEPPHGETSRCQTVTPSHRS